MSNYYNLDGIKTELKKEIARKETLLQAWQNVKFVTKKDGTPFINIGRNFENAKYSGVSYALQAGENELRVYGFCKLNGYVDDTITCYTLVKDLKNETMIAKTQNYLPKQTYLEQLYSFDIDDIKNAVADKINYLIDRIAVLYNELNIVDKCYNNFVNEYSKLISNLENECCKAGTTGYSGSRNDIFYSILDTVQNNYKYR